jgi:arabinoxylan arabinofuranohydrolase
MLPEFTTIKIGQPAHRALSAVGIDSYTKVCAYTEQELLALHGVGPKAIRVLKEVLEKEGMQWSPIKSAKKQITNPFLPFNEYIPDGEPHVFGDRVYLYGSHDEEGGKDYCLLDYVCYSAPLDDLKNWRYEGIIFKKTDEPANHEGTMQLFAPDVCQGPDGRYYLYYVANGLNRFSVAVCETPAGEYRFLGYVKYEDGRFLTENWPFDPAVLNDEGKIYMYFGFSPTNLNFPGMPPKEDILGGSVVELATDMVTVLCAPKMVIPSETQSKGSGFEGHEYFEGPSIRKIGRLYYLVYSSVLSHELCYATSFYPDREFKFGGTIISNADVGYEGRSAKHMAIDSGNNHGGIVKICNQWYVFYHRHTHGSDYSRQACAEPIWIQEDGRIEQVPITSCGLNGGPLQLDEPLSAFACCGLTNNRLQELFQPKTEVHFPYVTCEQGVYMAKGLDDGSVMTFKYIEVPKEKEGQLGVEVECRGIGKGRITMEWERLESNETVRFDEEVTLEVMWKPLLFKTELSSGVYILRLYYEGSGTLDVKELRF